MKVSALLFDLDGTLADTAIANAKAYVAALAEVDVHVDLKQMHQLASGRNWRQFLPPLLESSGTEIDPALIAKRKSHHYTTMAKDVEINTPLIKLLISSRPQLKTALVTTASSVNARSIIDFHGLTSLFDIIITGDDVTRHKPNPEAYLMAAKRLNVPTEECLAFEDSDIGISSAQAAGISAIRVLFQSSAMA